MYTHDKFSRKHPNLTRGMDVRSVDGERLGKITRLHDNYFVVEKGMFFPRDFFVRYDDIQDVQSDHLFLRLSRSDLNEWKDPQYAGWNQTEEMDRGTLPAEPREEYRKSYEVRKDELRIPVSEEELEARKTIRQSGEARIRKIVHTEYKHFTVPVTREEVRVERVPVSEGDRGTPRRGEFKEETITVPVMEEEVTIQKRPVVKEEVRVTKERHTEQKQVAGEVRKEEVEVNPPTRKRKSA